MYIHCNDEDVSILVNGKKVKHYSHKGKVFVEAKEGTEYEIQISNNRFSRSLALVSVDGLNPLNGEPHDNLSGFVLDERSSTKIKGFQYSDETVGAFKFSKKRDSYAEHQGDSSNVGVISVRFYSEKLKRCIYIEPIIRVGNPSDAFNPCSFPYFDAFHYSTCLSQQASTDQTTFPKIGAKCSSNAFDMGTDWGTKKSQKISETKFEMGSFLREVNIYYCSRESLIEMGVPLENKQEIVFPKGFKKYASPPPNWR